MSDDIQKLNFSPSSAVLLDSMGSDKTVVDAARVSFAKFGELGFGKGDPTMGDADLIRYLATGMRTKTRKLLMERITECESVDGADRIIEEISARGREAGEWWSCQPLHAEPPDNACSYEYARVPGCL